MSKSQAGKVKARVAASEEEAVVDPTKIIAGLEKLDGLVSLVERSEARAATQEVVQE